MQSLVRRVENGGVLSCAGVCQAAQPFFAVLLQKISPGRPLVVVAPDLKTQERYQQDIETWLGASPLFYPPWEILPHEGKLPHADTISDRLQTLVALSEKSATGNRRSAMIVTSVAALLQKTFPPGEVQKRTHKLQRGDKINPLDLIEWLEEQGYEPEAQVSQKGEIALRGGILDVWPLTSPWPARLEFFGDELESLRHFDPLTQISREEISSITIPPGGELGFLKKWQVTGDKWQETGLASDGQNLVTCHPLLATLLDYLPREALFLLCEPEQLAVHAGEYAQQIPRDDPFFVSWDEFQRRLAASGMTAVQLDGNG